jgi:membrane protein involved in colicin uptake
MGERVKLTRMIIEQEEERKEVERMKNKRMERMKELNTAKLEKDGKKVNRVRFDAQENQTKARFPPPPPGL